MSANTKDSKLTTTEILGALELFSEQFPKQAVLAAIEQREAITPELLRVLEEAATNLDSLVERTNYALLFYAMYLLAQFRETRAYRPLVRLVSADPEVVDAVLDDIMTEALDRMLCSVYDGDPEPLKQLVENDGVEDYVRVAAIRAFVLLAESGQMPRDEAVEYYRELFEGRLEREPSSVWSLFVSFAVDFAGPELVEHIRKAFADNLIEFFPSSLDKYEVRMKEPYQPSGEKTMITDTVAEMEHWAFLAPPVPEVRTKSLRNVVPPSPVFPTSPRVERRAKVGRNDPCPCRSGKKYKKCCGTVA